MINGSEKVLIAQERMANNHVYVFRKSQPSKFAFIAECRCAAFSMHASLPVQLLTPAMLPVQQGVDSQRCCPLQHACMAGLSHSISSLQCTLLVNPSPACLQPTTAAHDRHVSHVQVCF